MLEPQDPDLVSLIKKMHKALNDITVVCIIGSRASFVEQAEAIENAKGALLDLHKIKWAEYS